jgi:hypothetical protein
MSPEVETEDVMTKLTLAVASLVAIGTLTLAGSLNATTIAHTNYVTVSAPIALPGVWLSAGTYIFEVPLDRASLDVVRVKSGDGRKVYLTAFTQTVDRPVGQAGGSALVFGEAPSGVPVPVKTWFPAGERIGHAFIY